MARLPLVDHYRTSFHRTFPYHLQNKLTDLLDSFSPFLQNDPANEEGKETFRELTYRLVRNERLVIKAKNLCNIVQIRMLNCETPERVVHPVVEVCNGNLHAPVFFVIDLDMPVHSHRAHMVCTL